MSGGSGQIPDVRGENLFIKGKKVIDDQCRIKASAVTTSSLTVRKGVTTNGNINVCGTVKTDCLDSKTGGAVSVKKGVNATGIVNSDEWFEVGGVKVVAAQQSGINKPDGTLGNVSDSCNAIIDVLRAHGLIATPI